jgi:hypothetical protein
MKVSNLFRLWDQTASGELTATHYNVRLPVEDAAKLAALVEMYPKRTTEQLITDLISAALNDLESAMPYVEGDKVISRDELGDPLYEDMGPTPQFIALSHKHLMDLKKLN